MSIASLGIKENASSDDLPNRVDHIMQNHTGMGVKTLIINTYPCSNLDPRFLVMLTVGFKLPLRRGLKNLRYHSSLLDVLFTLRRKLSK